MSKKVRLIVTKRGVATAITLLGWVFVGFIVAQLLAGGVVWALTWLQVPIASLNESVFSALVAAIVYALTLCIVIGLPWWVRKKRTTTQELGLTRLPSWIDILLTPVGFIVYVLFSAALISLASSFLPWVDVDQTQTVGFEQISHQYEYVLAFVTLVVVAPVAEEMLFRGYLYGKLKRYIPRWLAVLATSALFGLAHGQWNVGIDVFALSIVLCVLREASGSLWPSILLHMTKNGLAFYLLFINPTLLHTIGQ